MYYTRPLIRNWCLIRIIPKQPGFMLLVACLVIHGCAGTNHSIRKSSHAQRDGAPDNPIDVDKVPDPIPRHEAKSKSGNPSSYVVWGKRYYVMHEARDFVQRGLASWYGTKFHGRRTSSGEPYDMYAMTAAHKTLPLPCYLQVKNLENGRSIVVRVNDRGPFHDHRIVDLSYTAAKKLDIVRTGTGYVEIRNITPPRQTVPVTIVRRTDSTKLYVQIGAFKNRANADKLLSSIDRPWLPDTRIKAGTLDREPVYRVQLGPIDTFGEARRVVARLGEIGFTSTRVVRDPASPYINN
ncbi:MAG: septal ring lytic transglycosylase RlpA family protein [Methylococcaceae bacterium]|nr:septal ring lytic transglycosylase RlpA family protein [Methylococcaceae bacterium]